MKLMSDVNLLEWIGGAGTSVPGCVVASVRSELDDHLCYCCIIRSTASGKWPEILICNLVCSTFLISILFPTR